VHSTLNHTPCPRRSCSHAYTGWGCTRLPRAFIKPDSTMHTLQHDSQGLLVCSTPGQHAQDTASCTYMQLGCRLGIARLQCLPCRMQHQRQSAPLCVPVNGHPVSACLLSTQSAHQSMFPVHRHTFSTHPSREPGPHKQPQYHPPTQPPIHIAQHHRASTPSPAS
jgi:hypothetical protein